MNNLLSSIQQSFQPNTSQTNILQQQQINQQKINSLWLGDGTTSTKIIKHIKEFLN